MGFAMMHEKLDFEELSTEKAIKNSTWRAKLFSRTKSLLCFIGVALYKRFLLCFDFCVIFLFFGSASSKASTKEMDRIDHLFNQYANKSSNLIE